MENYFDMPKINVRGQEPELKIIGGPSTSVVSLELIVRAPLMKIQSSYLQCRNITDLLVLEYCDRSSCIR